MKRFTHHLPTASFGLLAALVLSFVPLSTAAAVSSAATAPTTDSSTGTSATATAAKQTTELNLIISRGNTEISRRLASLGTLSSKITSTAKLSSTDKATLSANVTSEISSLTTLKTTLDADTTVASARTDAQSIITGYRVYALVVPQTDLVRVADDQQVAEAKLTTLAGKLQTRLTAEQTAGQSVTTLLSDLSDMNSKISAAQSLSTGIETAVINLQPTDYDSNHTVLSGDKTQLQTAQTDIKAAATDAQSIITGLTALKS